jgi:hypothetical protein
MAIDHCGDYEKLIRDVRADPALAEDLKSDPKLVLAKYAVTDAEKEQLGRIERINVVFDDDDVKHVVIPTVMPEVGPQFICC